MCHHHGAQTTTNLSGGSAMASIRKRTRSDGATTYRVDVRLKGFPAQRATFARLTDAKRWATQTEAAIREGRHFKTTEAKSHTFSDMANRYIDNVLPTKPKQQAAQTQQLKWWMKQFGDYLLADVTPALIAESRDKLRKEITPLGTVKKPSTVIRYMAVLSHCFNVAINEWSWLEHNPMRKVTKPREPKGRVRFLSEDERTRLLEACKQSDSPYLYIVVVIALSTGMRKAEIMGMSWPDLDLIEGKVTLYQTKNGEIRTAPITGLALTLLKEHSKVRLIGTNLLFPGKVNQLTPIDLRTPWETALKKAEIDDFKFHDLRHSAASYLAMNGATLAELAEILGHKTLQMVKRYAHFSEAHTAGVVERMNKKIFESE